MKIKKDIIELDKSFPFEIKEQHLLPYHDMNKTYHWHKCLEISYIKEGYGKYHVQNTIYEMEPGDIIVINNIEPHYLEVYDNKMIQTVLIFNPSFVFSDLSNRMDYHYLKPFLERGSDFDNKLTSYQPFMNEIIEQILGIENEFREKSKGYELMIKARLLIILSYLTRYYRDPEEKNKPNKQNLHRVETAIEYIHRHFKENITLKDVANRLYISPQYFCTIFKETTGLTFNNYLNKIRINRSIKLLKENDYKITYIAGECGYNNTTSFNNVFKKYTGKTPSEFRK